MYRGSAIPIVAGAGSFNGADNVARVPITDLIRARNITAEGDAWRKTPGGSAFDPVAVSGTPNHIAGYDWVPIAGTQRIISAWSDGKIYREALGNVDAATLVTLGTPDTMGIFVAGGAEVSGNNRKLFYFSESNPVKVLDGDASVMNTISTPPADWTGANQPIGGTIHDGSLVGWGNPNYKHGVYASVPTNHEDFTSAGSALVKVYPGEGERIVAGISFIPYRLYVWKYPRGLYFIDTTGGFASPKVVKVRDDVGAAGPGCVVRAGNDVLFLSAEGSVHSLTAVQSSEDLRDSDITAQLNLEFWMRDQVSITRLNRARMLYFGQKKQAFVAVTSKGSIGGFGGSAVNDRLLLLDASREPVRGFWDDKSAAYEGLFLRRDTDGVEKPTGGKLGKILLFDRVSRNVDGLAYNAEFEIPTTDFGWYDPELASRDKRFDYLEITIVPTGSYSMSFDIFIDGRYTQTITTMLGSSGGTLGSFILGTDRLGGRQIVNHKARLHGRGRYFAVRGYNSGLNQDFSISTITVHLKALGKGGTK